MGDVPRVEYGSRNYQDFSGPKLKKETDELIYYLMKDSKIDQKEIEKKVVEFLDKYKNHKNFPEIKGELLLELQKEIKDRRKKLESFREKNDISNMNEIADQINKLDVIVNTVRKIVLEQDKSAMKGAKDRSFAVPTTDMQVETMSGTIGTDEASDKINGARILQGGIRTTIAQSIGSKIDYWNGINDTLGIAKECISKDLKQAQITNYNIQQILQKFEKSVTKISQDNAGINMSKINGFSSNDDKKNALVNVLMDIYQSAIDMISTDIKSIKNNHAAASEPKDLTDKEERESKKFELTFCYHGGPLSKDDPKLKGLAGYRVVIIKTGDKAGNWKKTDVDNLRAAAKEQENDNIQILSYISLGAADDADRTSFESILRNKYPNLKPKDIWMNPDRKQGEVQGAQINLSNPNIRQAWKEFKEAQIKEAIGQNLGGGVFWDDSDVINAYLDKRNDTKTIGADKEKWQKAVNEFTDLYKSSCEAVRKGNPEATIYQNRGDSMRDPNSYKVKNMYGSWVNDTDDSVVNDPNNEKYSSKTDETLKKNNSSVTFENIQEGERVTWKNRIMNSLVSEPPKFINIINYYKAEAGKNPSILPEETQKLIKECCEKAAMARKEMGLRQLSIADLQKFITVQYYDGPALPMIAEQIFPPPQR